jgi:sulfide dehydrogenase cytochrome subunit
LIPRVLGAGLCLLSFAAVDAAGPGPTGPSIEALSFNCYTCHGPGGRSPAGMPTLQGKQADYLLRRLLEFKQGRGHPTIMDRIARGYSDEELARIAAYIAADAAALAGQQP